MQRAIKFRKRLAKAWIFLLLVLLLAFGAGIRSAYETQRTNGWVSHTQQVLAEAASVRLVRLRMRNDLWFYRASGRDEFRSRYEVDRGKLRESTAMLRELTADNASQQAAINQIGEAIQQQVALLDRAMEKAQSAKQSGEPQEQTAVISTDDTLTGMMDTFEEEERRLFATRSENVQKSARFTLDFLIAAGALASSLLLLAGYYIQREVIMRAEIESGLLRARELMGLQLNQKSSELGHVVDDLHKEIVARNEAEEELRRLNAELEARVAKRTEELQEMNRELESFNYSVSHDLRAPLRHMDGFSRILEEEFTRDLSGEARHYLQRIRVAARQMSELVDDLLQLARYGRQAIRRDVVSLEALVKETISVCMEGEAGREILWKVEPLPDVEADAVLLRQVMANLISNALKFSKNRTPAEIEIRGEEKDGQITVSVRDNGVGFDPRYADKLFGVFQRLHRQDEFEGTGIGLAIVARIIHKHGGRVWAESEPERGATFYFTLDGAQKEPEPAVETIGANA